MLSAAKANLVSWLCRLLEGLEFPERKPRRVFQRRGMNTYNLPMVFIVKDPTQKTKDLKTTTVILPGRVFRGTKK